MFTEAWYQQLTAATRPVGGPPQAGSPVPGTRYQSGGNCAGAIGLPVVSATTKSSTGAHFRRTHGSADNGFPLFPVFNIIMVRER
jgi:hypothetical protein